MFPVIFTGKPAANESPEIHIYASQGALKYKLPAPDCLHGGQYGHELLEVKVHGQSYLAISCMECQVIRLHRTRDGTVVSVYKAGSGIMPSAMCGGPDGMLFFINAAGTVPNRRTKSRYEITHSIF